MTIKTFPECIKELRKFENRKKVANHKNIEEYFALLYKIAKIKYTDKITIELPKIKYTIGGVANYAPWINTFHINKHILHNKFKDLAKEVFIHEFSHWLMHALKIKDKYKIHGREFQEICEMLGGRSKRFVSSKIKRINDEGDEY